MLPSWIIITLVLVFISFLFILATYGDTAAWRQRTRNGSMLVYALSLSIYVTSWTFIGSVDLASLNASSFFSAYLGPILLFIFGYPLIARIITIAKNESITSISDFMASRYGKNTYVALIVTAIMVTSVIPFIAMQLSAISKSVITVLSTDVINQVEKDLIKVEIGLVVCAAMILFSILFGTRHSDATEHQNGLMLAISAESIMKFIALVFIGLYVLYVIFDGPILLTLEAWTRGFFKDRDELIVPYAWITTIFVQGMTCLLMPRVFHAIVIENKNIEDLRRGRWIFIFYLLAISIFILPIGMAGFILFQPLSTEDNFIITIPMASNADGLVALVFVAIVAAATTSSVLTTVAVAIMISNSVVIPILIQKLKMQSTQDISLRILSIRRVIIFSIILCAYLLYQVVPSAGDMRIYGVLSTTLMMQVAPAFYIGLYWKKATALGAISGMTIGMVLWVITIMMPNLILMDILDQDIYAKYILDGLGFRAIYEMISVHDPYTSGTFVCFVANILALITVSIFKKPNKLEEIQADLFLPNKFRSNLDIDVLPLGIRVKQLQQTLSNYINEETVKKSFEVHAQLHGQILRPDRAVDSQLLRFAENQLAKIIGVVSARLVISELIQKESVDGTMLENLEQVTGGIQYNRQILQAALNHVAQGIAVFDNEQRLICWNAQYYQLLNLETRFDSFGVRLTEILNATASALHQNQDVQQIWVNSRLNMITQTMQNFQIQIPDTGMTVEARPTRIPDGGFILTLSDITEQMQTEAALAIANTNLEKRVIERTEELTHLNEELYEATIKAEEANMGKTRFLAAAGHDILQPLNAARLYTALMVEKSAGSDDEELAHSIDLSLESVEEILSALLDISRLDAGALKSDPKEFPINQLLKQMEIEYVPVAKKKNLNLKFVSSGAMVFADARLLRRVLQNLISNAIKYTQRGKVLVGCRVMSDFIRIDVLDTGTGIAPNKQKIIFNEFERLEDNSDFAPGLGLGLSIVDRITHVANWRLEMKSELGKGSRFSIYIPMDLSWQNVERQEVSNQQVPLNINIEGLVVLCVDNDLRILGGMKSLLENWGCQVLSATSLQTAKDELELTSVKPGLALIDYHLDTETGIDVVNMLYDYFDEQIPSALVTADRSELVRDHAEELNVRVLNKPVKPGALRSFISEVVADS